MIFETLDLIDWKAVGTHVYGEPEKIPAMIRQLLSPDSESREEALMFLFGEGQNFGEVWESTAHIIPFALEVLADDTQPGHIEILRYFQYMTVRKIYTGGRPEYSVLEMRTYLNTYNALEGGIPIYLKLLDSQDAEVRAASANVLAGLNANAADLLLGLRDRFAVENVEKTQIALVEAIARLLKEMDYSGTEPRKAYAPFFFQIAESDASLELRFTAVKSAIMASVSQGFVSRLRADEVKPVLSNILIERYWSFPDEVPRPYYRKEIVELLALLPDTAPLVGLLRHPDTTDEEAHIIVRGLLAHYLNPSDLRAFWRFQPERQRGVTAKIYEIFSLIPPPILRNAHKGPFWDALRLIADSDKFWSIPTNLLSVMFNLPDDREQFRAFIDQE